MAEICVHDFQGVNKNMLLIRDVETESGGDADNSQGSQSSGTQNPLRSPTTLRKYSG